MKLSLFVLNASLPTDVTLSGKLTSPNFWQSAKADSPIDSKPSGKLMLCSFDPAKASLPIYLTESGSVTFLTLESLKAPLATPTTG